MPVTAALLLLARVSLAAVFAVAGAAKLADRGGARAALAGFGVPARAVAPLAVALPLAELAIAVAVLPAATAPYAAVAAVALTALFALAIARALRAGRAPDCHCFGRLHSAPAGPGTLARNGLLAGLAAAVAVDGLLTADGAPAFGELSLSTTAAAALGGGLLLALLVSGAAWFGWELLRQNGRLLERVDRLEAAGSAASAPLAGAPRGGPLGGVGLAGGVIDGATGATAPDLVLAGLDGAAVPLSSLGGDGRPALLLFSDPSCGPCRALLPEVAAWQRELDATVVLVSGEESAADAHAHAREHGIDRLLLDPDDAVFDALRVAGTPSAVILDGGLASPPAAGAEAIRALVATLGSPPQSAPGSHRAADVPRLPLHHVAGRGDQNADHADDGRAGHPSGSDGATLLVFWNPACGFCAQILGELRALDRRASANEGARLVVVSSAPAEQNEALGLAAAQIVNDEGFALGRAFGAAATPSAVLLGADGRAVSPVAVGADAVLALAGPLPAAMR